VILNDNSSNGTARAWGGTKLGGLARWLAERLPDPRVLIHCGPADRQQAREVVTRAAHPAVAGLHDVPDLPIGLSTAVFARAALAVSSDSGPRHIAAAFGVPTVALVGPTDPRLGRSDPDRCVEVRRDLACSPCGKQDCPLIHHDCLRLVTIEEVGQAGLDLWARFPDHSPRHSRSPVTPRPDSGHSRAFYGSVPEERDATDGHPVVGHDERHPRRFRTCCRIDQE
jgi:heptosyltransferase-2